jgi:two-component system, NtrC family, sensor histidine kinase KinB
LDIEKFAEMKRRIFFGLAPIFVLIVVMSAYAIMLFAKLGSRVDVVLRENFRSVLAGQQMKEAAERMDSALFFSLVGQEAQGRDLYARNVLVFKSGLTTEENNITLPGEGDLANKIRDQHENYARMAESFWKISDMNLRRTMYFSQLLPSFTKIKDEIQGIITMNQDNMMKADRDARELSARSTRYMILASALGLLAAVFFAIRLQKAILHPIHTLTSVAKELGEGKLDQIVPVESHDELGQLADAFNKMASKLRAYRQVASDQIMQARQMTEITFSAFPDPIIAFSQDGVINFANPAASTLLQKIGSTGKLPASVQAEVEKILKGGLDFLPTSFEKTVVVRVDDKEVFLLPRVIGVRDDSGDVLGAAAILQDVTRLRLLDEVKTNLVSTVSHELKTPLTSVRMGLHLLLEERIGTLNPKQTELLLAAREDSERLLGMINDLLDLAKLESGHVHLHRESVDASTLLKSVEEDLETLVESRGSKLNINIENDLPKISVDRRQISHVFSNLVSNAVKHTRHGEEITLSAKTHDGLVRFSVADQGPGIPPQFQSHIFDRFFRVPGEPSSGAGLGLAIAKQIVVAHSGAIGVSSQPGAGAEFYFDLPALSNGAAL